MVAHSLTAKQAAFADALLDGMTGSEAYRTAYNTRANPRVRAVKATRLRQTPAIMAYIAEKQAEADRLDGLERQEKRRLLASIARDPNASPSDRMKAIELDSKMAGHLQPEKVEVFGMADLLSLVRSRSRDPQMTLNGNHPRLVDRS